MVELSVDGNTLAVEVLGWSKLWCLKSRLDIPLRCVRPLCRRVLSRDLKLDLYPGEVWHG